MCLRQSLIKVEIAEALTGNGQAVNPICPAPDESHAGTVTAVAVLFYHGTLGRVHR